MLIGKKGVSGTLWGLAKIFDVLKDLRDNLIFNHNRLKEHSQRMKSLEYLTADESGHQRLLGTLHNIDVFSRDLTKGSLRNLDNLRYVNVVMRDTLSKLKDEAILLANAVHFDASCFAHHYHTVSCAKDVPRVNFSSAGLLILEYYTEEIVLENRPFYTCLPVKYGLSYKHHHYAVQITGSSILLNDGRLIMNSTDREAFSVLPKFL